MKELLKNRKFRWLVIALSVTIPFLVLSFFDVHAPIWIELPLFLVIIALAGWKIFLSGFKGLLSLRFSNINLLMTIAVFGAIYLRQFEEAVVIVILFSIGESLEEYGIKRSKKALEALVDKTPKTAVLRKGKKIVSIDNISIGQVIIVKPGDMIPMDGKVVYGDSLVDESSITGEPLPKNKYLDDQVYAGTLNGNGYLEIEVLKKARDNTLAKIIELTYRAAEKKMTPQRFIEKFARYYTPSVIGIAVLLVVIPVAILGNPFDYWFNQALTLLIISCPCALVISTPVTIFSALGSATKNGVLIKGGKFLEEMGRLKAIAFDKTRTLTMGKPEVSDIAAFNGFSKEEVLACAAGLEVFSEHPIASSILDKAEELDLDTHIFHDFKSIAGKGLRGQCTVCKNSENFLGSLRFIKEEQKIKIDKTITDIIDRFEKQGKTVIVMSENTVIKGVIAITDRLRKEAKPVIENIKNSGIEPVILTGDTIDSARFTGNELGIEKVSASLLPQEKAEEIEQLKREYGHIAMVGDGVNDAPSLAVSSVGIAMGSAGSDIAIENSDIALMNDNLETLPYLVRLGKKSTGIIRFNVVSAILIKFIVLLLAVLGISSLTLAIVADVGVTIFVIINGLRLFGFSMDRS